MKILKLLSILSVLLLTNLSLSQPNPASVSLPNPASVNCVKKGGVLKMVDNFGICQFKLIPPSECEEWALYRGKCKIGDCKQVLIKDNQPVCIK